MEGNRLILKRKIPRGRQRLVAIFAGAFAVAGLVIIAQMKATLSAHSLEAVRADLTNMRAQVAEQQQIAPLATAPAAPVASSPDIAVDKFKKLLQDTPVTP